MKIILDLCGGTGSWSKPYKEAGYEVKLVTLPENDVREFLPPENVHGILCAPPCTHFSVSGAQYWKQKDADGRTLKDLEILTHCLRIIARARPAFYAIENPVGRMKYFLGKPDFVFDPCDFGDPYTKKTCLWGNFNHPAKNWVEPLRVCSQGSWLQKLGGKSEKTKTLRSITPQGFARAFFEVNP
jgi:hypothetical protein